MKKIFNYKKWSSIILFFSQIFYSCLSLADTAAIINFTPPTTDVSLGYLGKMFGVVGTVLQGTGGSLLGIIFQQFNISMVCIGGLLLSYTTVRTIVGTAQDGESLGKKISPWMVMRSAVGISFLAPTLTGGYTMLQGLIMWMVMQR